MEEDGLRALGADHQNLSSAEEGLAVLLEACERAVEEIGSAVPPAQLRALLIVDLARRLNLSGLARALGASVSATSRLTDRMQAGGLLTREAALSRREVVLVPTEPGRRLAEHVRVRRRAALQAALEAMSPAGGAALTRGLGELASPGSLSQGRARIPWRSGYQ